MYINKIAIYKIMKVSHVFTCKLKEKRSVIKMGSMSLSLFGSKFEIGSNFINVKNPILDMRSI